MAITPVRSLSEIAADGVAIQLDPAGRPVAPLLVVDLTRARDATMDAAIHGLRDHISASVVVGVSDEPVPETSAARRLIDVLDVVLAPSAPGSAHAGSADDLTVIDQRVARSPLAACRCHARPGIADDR